MSCQRSASVRVLTVQTPVEVILPILPVLPNLPYLLGEPTNTASHSANKRSLPWVLEGFSVRRRKKREIVDPRVSVEVIVIAPIEERAEIGATVMPASNCPLAT